MIELIMVIALVAILSLLLVPNVISLTKKNNIKSCETLKDNIESAAKVYVTNNKYNLGFDCNTNKTKNITLKTLVDSGDLEGNLTNPITKENINLTNNTVSVTYDCDTKTFSYKVNGINCE